jgi:hypothetical protein
LSPGLFIFIEESQMATPKKHWTTAIGQAAGHPAAFAFVLSTLCCGCRWRHLEPLPHEAKLFNEIYIDETSQNDHHFLVLGFSDATVLKKFGDVPDDLSGL